MNHRFCDVRVSTKLHCHVAFVVVMGMTFAALGYWGGDGDGKIAK